MNLEPPSSGGDIAVPVVPVDLEATAGVTPPSRWRRIIPAWHNLRHWSVLHLLMFPTVFGVLLFTYWPNGESLRYAFYRWDGASIEEFTGLANFTQAFARDPLFWASFQLVGIFLLANLVKMWPSILVAIALHRLVSTRAQYVYRVLLVVPMVIPGLVWLLIWKAFFTEGMLNELLNATGAMAILAALDSPTHGLPALAGVWSSTVLAWDPAHPAWSASATPLRWLLTVTGSASGLALAGAMVCLAAEGRARLRRRWLSGGVVLALALLLVGWVQALVLLPLLAVVTARVVERNPIDRPTWARRGGWAAILLGVAIVLLTGTWTTAIGAFDGGQPAWLGHSRLVIPALVLWGFPWIGSIGVLIYLAGLQSISREVYEAAELDGVGSWGKAWRIELPLIMSQVRINLIFLSIGTLGDFGFTLILLGPGGGPDNVAMVPGLYMYNQAFLQGEFGYACTLGMILFALTLVLTVLYQRLVRVDK